MHKWEYMAQLNLVFIAGSQMLLIIQNFYNEIHC